MIKIRKGVFETNSSSTHSICITESRDTEKYPSQLEFRLGQFGWEVNLYRTCEEKASYLYTALVEIEGEDKEALSRRTNWIYEVLGSKGVEATFEDPKDSDFYYVDHSYNCREFLEAVLGNEKRLLRFLFSEESFVTTGNDNGESYYFPQVDYDYEEYYKGN